jgi:hypothetical protein
LFLWHTDDAGFNGFALVFLFSFFVRLSEVEAHVPIDAPSTSLRRTRSGLFLIKNSVKINF